MAKVRPIPKGYHSVTPGLTVPGADAFIKFCKKAFGAKEMLRMLGPDGSVMHCELAIGDSRVMCGEENLAWGNKSARTLGGSPVQLYIYVDKCDAVFKKAVAAGASVKMPLEDMFWGDRMGSLVDPFGNTWGIASRTKNLTPQQMKKAGAVWAKEMAAKQAGGGQPQ